jgi:hypothetical protein
MVGVTAVLTALLAGTFFGDDDSFPFGPFRMYSVTNRTSGLVEVAHLEGVTVGDRRREIDFASFGMRGAEIEGQTERFVNDPGQLQLLVEAYETKNPEGPQLVELHLVQEVHQLERGRPVETTEKTLASWPSS